MYSLNYIGDLLKLHKVKFEFGDYCGYKSIVIKKNKYKLEIF